jgi:hypothetical protein
MIKDNPICIYNSNPTDVLTKSRHTDLLKEYLKLEPYVSLRPDRVVAGEEFSGREFKTEIDHPSLLCAELKRETRDARNQRPSLSAGG